MDGQVPDGIFSCVSDCSLFIGPFAGVFLYVASALHAVTGLGR